MSAYARTRTHRTSPVELDDEKSRLALTSPTRDQEANAALNDPGHNFGQIAVQPAPETAPAVAPQMKLRVSQPGDAHEQEADQVADAVLRMPDAEAAASGETAAAHAMAGQSGGSQEAIPTTDGQPLDAATRAYMEPRFGHDFGQVRVHTDERAAQAASDFQARAYTVGSDIVFGAEQYAPDTSAGRQLLAHELTHVVQQAGGSTAAATVQREPAEAPEAVPEAVPAIPGAGGVSAAQLTDEELARGIMDKQYAILDGWDTALQNFDKVLTSSSDKEANPDFAHAIVKFISEEVVGDVLKLATDSEAIGWGFKLLIKLKEEAERAEKAELSATVRDFYVQHKTAIGKMKMSTLSGKEEFAASARIKAEAMAEAETAASSSSSSRTKGKKGKPSVVLATSKEAEAYGMMRMAMVDTYGKLDARVDASTPENLFIKLSEEWIRNAMVSAGMGVKIHAVVVIRLNPDYSVKDAHIQGAGGQKIAEQLLKDNPEGVNVFNLEVPRVIKLMASNGWPSAMLSLDENDRDVSTGSIMEGNTDSLYRYVMDNGLPPTTKLDGDD